MIFGKEELKQKIEKDREEIEQKVEIAKKEREYFVFALLKEEKRHRDKLDNILRPQAGINLWKYFIGERVNNSFIKVPCHELEGILYGEGLALDAIERVRARIVELTNPEE